MKDFKTLSAIALALISNYDSAQAADQVNFKTFSISEPVNDIMWCGDDNSIILSKTTEGSIYRSRDQGENWKKLEKTMMQSA